MDSKLVYNIFAKFFISRSRHPFEAILINPLISFTKIFITSQRVAFNFLMAICASLSTALIYLGMHKLSDDKKCSAIISLIYGFSFSALIFSTIPEIYIFSGFINTAFLYYIILLYKNPNPICNKQLLTLALLLFIAFGINPINVATGIIPATWIICIKSGKSILEKSKNIIGFIFLLCLIYIVFSFLQKLAFPYKPFKYISGFKFSNFNIHWALRDMFVVPFYALKSYIELNLYRGTIWQVPKAFMFLEHQHFAIFIPAILFYGSIVINYLKKIKSYTYNNLICILLFPLTISFFSNMCVKSSWLISLLFSQNFLPYLVFFLGLLIIANKNIFIKYICISFIIWQLTANMPTMIHIINFVNETSTKHYPSVVWFIYSVITICIIIFLKNILTKVINKNLLELNEENKVNILVYTYISYVFIWGVFMAMFHTRG